MADATVVHRKYLKASVGAVCLEKGFNATTRQAIETLTEMVQSYLSEVGRSSLAICELAGRSKPTLNDVRLALVEMGCDVDELNTNTTRSGRSLIAKPTQSRPFQAPKPLQSGTKETQPSYVPNYLPAFPDPHSYIKTLTYRKEAEEYALCRDNYAAMRRDVETGLAKFLSKTSISEPIVKNCTDASNYLLMVNDAPKLSYLTALMPCAEDCFVNIIKPSKTLREQDDNDTEKTTPETPDNPYKRPAKRLKTSET